MTDLEARLRATYRAVAEHTVVAPEPLPFHAVQPLSAPERPTHRRVLIGLGAAACLLAALVVVVLTRHPVEPADRHSERTVAVPTYVPAGFAYHEAGASSDGGVWGFEGTFDIQLLEYRRGFETLVVSSAPVSDARLMAGHHTVELLSGVVATVATDPDITSIAWAQPNGPIVSVRGNGMSEADLLDVANALWYVTPAMFDDLNRHAGFASLDEQMKVVDGWRIPGDAFPTAVIGVRGSLQTGTSFAMFDGQVGFTGAPASCFAHTADNDGAVILVGPGTTTSFVLTRGDGTTLDVPASSPPGLPTIAVGAVRVSTNLPDGSSPRGDSAQCVRGTR